MTKQEFKIYKDLISTMTSEEIERRSLLVGLLPATPKNKAFQMLLTKEYNKRKSTKINYNE